MSRYLYIFSVKKKKKILHFDRHCQFSDIVCLLTFPYMQYLANDVCSALHVC